MFIYIVYLYSFLKCYCGFVLDEVMLLGRATDQPVEIGHHRISESAEER